MTTCHKQLTCLIGAGKPQATPAPSDPEDLTQQTRISRLTKDLCPFFTTSRQRRLTEVGGFGLAEVPVELGPVRLLQARAEAEVGELDVPPRVQQQVVRLDIPVERTANVRIQEGVSESEYNADDVV